MVFSWLYPPCLKREVSYQVYKIADRMNPVKKAALSDETGTLVKERGKRSGVNPPSDTENLQESFWIPLEASHDQLFVTPPSHFTHR